MSTNILEPPPANYSPGNNLTASIGSIPLPTLSLTPSAYNPRTNFDPTALRELAASIRDHGVLQPILVRPIKDEYRVRYEIVAGERRYRAAKLADQELVPCIVRELSDEDAVLIAVTENLQRADLSPFEEARGFELMMELPGMTQNLIAVRLGCSQSRVNKMLNLRKLPDAVRTMIENEELTPSHGQRLLPYADFPQACTSLALVAAKGKWPAAKLDGAALSAEAVQLVEDIKPNPIRELGFGTRFNWRDICPNLCPFKAYRPHEYESRGVCLKPEHYDQLQKEHDEARAAQQEIESRKAVEAFVASRKPVTILPVLPPPVTAELCGVPNAAEESADDWEDLGMVGRAAQALTNAATYLITSKAAPLPEMPSIREMAHNSYRQVTYGKGGPTVFAPPGCTADCPCRGLARNYSGEVIEICSNPARYDKLKQETQKDERQERRVESEARLAEALRALDKAYPVQPALFIDNEPWAFRQGAAAAVLSAVQAQGEDHVRKAMARRAMTIDSVLFKSGTRDSTIALMTELAHYASSTLIALAVEVQCRREAKNVVEWSGSPCPATDFLTGRGEK